MKGMCGSRWISRLPSVRGTPPGLIGSGLQASRWGQAAGGGVGMQAGGCAGRQARAASLHSVQGNGTQPGAVPCLATRPAHRSTASCTQATWARRRPQRHKGGART